MSSAPVAAPAPLRGRALRRAWAEPTSLTGLADRTVRWLVGDLHETPGHMGPPDEETDAIRDDLIAINRAGFVTTGSQPGLDPTPAWDGEPWEQRAFLEGYTTPEKAAAVQRAALDAGLVCRVEPVADMPLERPWNRDRTPADAVTLHGDHVNTAVPGRWYRQTHDMGWGRPWISRDADGALHDSHHVVVVDSHWGERQVLWATVRGALGVPS